MGDNQSTLDIFYSFLEGCLKLVKENCESEWLLGERGILTINRGIQAIIRIIDDIVTHLVNQSKINPKIQDLEMLIAEVEYYIEPLADYLNKVDDMQRKELKGFLGGGADNKFWRSFQKVIAETRDDFLPEGLSEYIENETKQYNTESSAL